MTFYPQAEGGSSTVRNPCLSCILYFITQYAHYCPVCTRSMPLNKIGLVVLPFNVFCTNDCCHNLIMYHVLMLFMKLIFLQGCWKNFLPGIATGFTYINEQVSFKDIFHYSAGIMDYNLFSTALRLASTMGNEFCLEYVTARELQNH